MYCLFIMDYVDLIDIKYIVLGLLFHQILHELDLFHFINDHR
jgi:hypothetical protein